MSIIKSGTTSTTAYIVEGNTNGDLVLQTNGTTTAVTIDTSQNVGIGTSTPTQKLHVNGLVRATEFVSSNPSWYLIPDDTSYLKEAYWTTNPSSGTYLYTYPTYLQAYNSTTGRTFAFDTGTSNSYINLGNLGIGTTTPAEKLEVKFSTNGYILANNSTDTNTGIKFQNTGRTYGIFTDGGAGASNSLRFYDFTASAERMRIDASGNLLVGRTSSGTLTVAGSEFQAGGAGFHIRDGGTALYVGRKTSNGNLVEFSKDGTTVGTIGAEGGDALYIQSGTTSGSGLRFHPTSGVIGPVRNGLVSDATLSIGASGQRFTNLYLSGGAYLGGTGAANYLNDYEEGTWTPTITGTSTNPSYTASQASGNYTKIGRMVYVEFLIVITAVSSQGTGNVNIAGLPFTSGSTGYANNISFTYNDTWDSNIRNGYTSSTHIQPIPNSITQSNISWAAVTLSTGYFSGSGWYIA